jgi:hypothetical protein
MKPSTFILKQNRVLPVLSFAVVERFFNALSTIPDCSQESAITIAYRDTFPLWKIPPISSDWFQEPLEAIEALTKPVDAAGGGVSTKLLASLSSFLGEQDIDVSLLAMCGFDYKKAEYLYTEVDCSFVKKLMKFWAKSYMEVARANFECALYAGGNKLEGEGSGGKPEVKDPTSMMEARRRGLPMASEADMALLMGGGKK